MLESMANVIYSSCTEESKAYNTGYREKRKEGSNETER